ncbi:MAG: CHASE2 domain-containing protein [Candidatus Methylacidiphilales bacterium]
MNQSIVRGGTIPAFSVACAVLIVSLAGAFDGLNRSFFDFAQRQQADQFHVPEEAVLVLIDEQAMDYMSQNYNQRWPWSRDAFAALFLALHQAGAERIVVDLMFLENSSSVELDDLLGSYAAAMDGLILAAPQGKRPVFWTTAFSQQHPSLKIEERIGHVDYQPDADGVIRSYKWKGSLAQKASSVDPGKDSVLLRWYGGLRELPPAQVLSARAFMERGYGPEGWLARVSKSGVDEYDPERLRKALGEQPLPNLDGVLKGKTVFVGTNAAGTFDVKAVPVSDLEPGVLAHFTAWCNAQQKVFIQEFGLFGQRNAGQFSFSVLAAFVLAMSLTAWGWSRADVRLLSWLTLLGVTGLLSISYFLLPFFSFPPSTPVASVLMVFGLLTTRHWLEESRRKKEVQDLFGSYVSPAVVQRLVEHPDSLKMGGEKKELSVYFSDLAGFTDMSETMPPEELVDLVNLYLTEMSEFILEEQGYLDKYIGDAIMGVFGAPEALENHALSACRAALKSRDHLKLLNQRMGVQHGKELYARIGINTGEMIVGNLGSVRKRNYTVVGDAVNLASRLEAANKEFGTTILLGMRTEELARDWIVTRPVELLRVKGKQQPVQTYELLALKSTAREQDLELSECFVRGYQSYQQRRFDQALLDFEKAASIRADDFLSKLYVERCRELIQSPPADDWDGVLVMKRK